MAPNTPPEYFAALSEVDTELLEAFTMTYLAKVALQRLAGLRPPDPS
jgi:hypothetical protein